MAAKATAICGECDWTCVTNQRTIEEKRRVEAQAWKHHEATGHPIDYENWHKRTRSRSNAPGIPDSAPGEGLSEAETE